MAVIPARTDTTAFPDATGQPANRIAETDGSDGWTFIATPSGATVVGAKAHIESDQSSSGTVTYDVEDYDLGNDFDPTTGLFTCPADGIYQVHFIHHARSSTAGVFATVNKNGSRVDPYHRYSLAANASVDWTHQVNCSAGDELGVDVGTAHRRGDASPTSSCHVFFSKVG